MITLTDGRKFDDEKFKEGIQAKGIAVLDIKQCVKNGNSMTAVTFDIGKDDEDSLCLSPSLYIENYKDEELNDIDRFCEIIFNTIQRNESERNEMNAFIKAFQNISKEEFLEGLQINIQKHNDDTKMVKRKYCDLDAVIKYPISNNASIQVTKSVLDKFGATEEEAWNAAEQNTFTEENFVIASLYDVLANMMMDKGISQEELANYLPSFNEGPNMYVVTDKDKTFGFTQVFNYKAVQKWMQDNSFDQVYVIPSSIHEAIFIPVDDETFGDNMTNSLAPMIQEVNTTQLSPQEVLSSHPYLIDVKDGIMQVF